MASMSLIDHVNKWLDYRDARAGTYPFRSRTRFKDVADRLFAMGLSDRHTVLDVGAGSCQFGQYLQERGWVGFYVPIDAVLDGTDLEAWEPSSRADFVVCIEVVEHLHNPWRLIAAMMRASRRGVVLTTPNAEAVDVLACDPTHVSVVLREHLEEVFTVERRTWFDVPNDSLLAWRQHA